MSGCRFSVSHQSYGPATSSELSSPIVIGLYGPDKKKTGTHIARNDKGKTYYVPAELQYVDWKLIYIDKQISYKTWKQGKGNFTHHNLSNIIKVNRTELHETPYAITQKISKKGNVEYNFYDAKGNQYLQVADSDHGHKSEANYGLHGEHAHWYDKRTEAGIPIHGKAGEIPSFIREKMGDKL